MINKEIQDKLTEVLATLDGLYTERNDMYLVLDSVNKDITVLEEARDRLLQADATLKGISDESVDSSRLTKIGDLSSP